MDKNFTFFQFRTASQAIIMEEDPLRLTISEYGLVTPE